MSCNLCNVTANLVKILRDFAVKQQAHSALLASESYNCWLLLFMLWEGTFFYILDMGKDAFTICV